MIAAILSVLVAGAGLGAGLATTVATAPPAGVVITPIVQPNHLVTTTGDGFAFADNAENTAAALAAVPPAGSTLVGGALIFVLSVAPTHPSGANSAYTFTDGVDTVTLPDSAITSSVINTQTVAVATLPSAFVGNSALPAAGFTGNIVGTGTRRWRFVAVYTTPGATTTKRVAFVVDPTAFAGTSIASPCCSTPLVPENVTVARVGGITEDNSTGATDVELREDSGVHRHSGPTPEREQRGERQQHLGGERHHRHRPVPLQLGHDQHRPRVRVELRGAEHRLSLRHQGAPGHTGRRCSP